MSVKGITLEQGTTVILDFDGTLVYIEDVQPTYAAVVALPEQPESRKADSQVFTAGAVRAKKISPFATAAKTVASNDLSDKNKEFITMYPALRDDHGPNFVFGKKAEAPVSVRKVKPADVDDPKGEETTPRGKKSRAEKQEARRAKRAAAKANNCAQCGQQRAAPIHDPKFDANAHDFVPQDASPAKEEPMTTGRGKPARSASNGATRYTLTSEDLTAARATEQGHKYADGNRFHRVFLALRSLPDKTGTMEDIMSAMLSDGGKIPSDPEKVTRRALQQLQTPAFGSIVTAA